MYCPDSHLRFQQASNSIPLNTSASVSVSLVPYAYFSMLQDDDEESGGPSTPYAKIAQACAEFLNSHSASELITGEAGARAALDETAAERAKHQTEQQERNNAWVRFILLMH